jgi:hypothetical protein
MNKRISNIWKKLSPALFSPRMWRGPEHEFIAASGIGKGKIDRTVER